jgi:hypothetical protein
VASNRALSEFWCWDHVTVAAKLDKSKSTVDNVSIYVSAMPAAHHSKAIAELALFILSQHRSIIGNSA